MTLTSWDELRTAYHVARVGTVSGAAAVLGVHHATVIRHIDALEAALGAKLFQRHARGYTPTEAGADLLRVAQATDDQIAQFEARIRDAGEAMTGEVTVTTLAELATPLAPVLAEYRRRHPGIVLRLLTGERLFRLEYGEAHVAIRAGSPPSEEDNVVQPISRIEAALYAAPAYAEAHGLPKGEAELGDHFFVGRDGQGGRAPFEVWLRKRVPAERVVYRVTSFAAGEAAVLAGAGLGFLPVRRAEAHEGLIQVLPPRDEWASRLWLVTHVDLHRSPKVQSVTAHLKATADTWAG